MDSLRLDHEKPEESRRVTEAVALELGWALLNEASVAEVLRSWTPDLTPSRYLSPIGVLHHPLIVAISALVLVFALVERRTLTEALAEAAELGWKFGLDISFNEESGATGTDLQQVKGKILVPSRWVDRSPTRTDCLNHLLRFSQMGIWETEIMSLLPVRPF